MPATHPAREPDLVEVPAIQVSLADLRYYLPWSVLCTKLLPFFDYDVGNYHELIPRAADAVVPPWDAELEAWYQMFHPATWVVLQADDKADWLALRDMHSSMQAQVPFMSDPVIKTWLIEMNRRLASLESRIVNRWTRLLGLHEVRTVYLQRIPPDQFYANLGQNSFDALTKPLPAGQHQVWPLPIPPPPHVNPTPSVYVHRSARPAGLNQAFSRRSSQSSIDYTLPDHRTPATSALYARLTAGPGSKINVSIHPYTTPRIGKPEVAPALLGLGSSSSAAAPSPALLSVSSKLHARSNDIDQTAGSSSGPHSRGESNTSFSPVTTQDGEEYTEPDGFANESRPLLHGTVVATGPRRWRGLARRR
ncbi:hypothetical protein JCM10213_006033 [Rhodosporidiobolus nylandii]